MSNCHPLKITYSIDAGYAKEYESIRVGGNFPFLMDNLSQAVAFKRKHGLTTHLNWYCTIGDYNVGEAERIVELANQIGLDSVNFTDLTLHGFGLAKNEHALRLKDNVADRLKMFEELKAKSPIPVYYLIEKQASCTLPWSQIRMVNA
jgi:MoaA/NifB/PqqE/SkfB family radical SAM enzyme